MTIYIDNVVDAVTASSTTGQSMSVFITTLDNVLVGSTAVDMRFLDVVDSVSVAASTPVGITADIINTAPCTDANTFKLIARSDASDTLSIVGSDDSQRTFTVADTTAVTDAVSFTRGADTADSVAVTSADVSNARMRMDTADAAVAISLADYLSSADSIITQMAVTDAVALSNRATLDVVDSAASTSAAVLGGVITQDALSAAMLTDVLGARAVVLTDAVSVMAMSSEATFDALMGAWVMNSSSYAMSRYTGLPYRSLAQIGGLTIALGESGFFQLDATTDDGVPIQASVKSGKLLLGTPMVKRLGDVYLGYTSNAPLALDITTYGGSNGTWTYALPARAAESPRGNRFTPGKGLQAKYFQFTLRNNGADFFLNHMTVDVAASTTRRI